MARWVLLLLILTGCEVVGQLTIYDDGRTQLSVGEVPTIPQTEFYPDQSGPGLMFYLKRSF